MTPFNMKEISCALREMISEKSHSTSQTLLFGAREAVYREIFIFHFPTFLEKLHQQIPSVSESEELICMLAAPKQDMDEIIESLCLNAEYIATIRSGICQKLNLPETELSKWLQDLLEE